MPTFRFGFSSGESSRFPRDLLTPQATSIPTEVVIKTIKLAQVTPEVNHKAKAEDSWENLLQAKSSLSSLLKFIEGSAHYLSINQVSVEHSTESTASKVQEGSATVPTVQCLQNSGKVQHKIRICEKYEFKFRLCLLFGLLCVLALAAFSTYRLHKIADYKVKELLIKPSPDEFFSRSFSGRPRTC